MNDECDVYELSATSGITLDELWNHLQQCDHCKEAFTLDFELYNAKDASMPLPQLEGIPKGIRDKKAFLAAYLTAHTMNMEGFKIKIGSAHNRLNDPDVVAWIHLYHEAIHGLLLFIALDAPPIIIESNRRRLLTRYEQGRILLGDHFAHAIGLLNSENRPPEKVLKDITKAWTKLLRPYLPEDADV